MKHWINPAMLAPNVLTCPVDPALVDGFAPLAERALGGDDDLAVSRPPWSSDIAWVSPRTEEGFAPFDRAFAALGVADLVAERIRVDRQIRLYGGFIVLRSRCDAPDFHCDWLGADNQAFTLLTPISQPQPGFGMLYRTLQGEARSYDYVRGEAIVFGDHFRHSTAPGRSDSPVALLCFNFGTDRMADWERIRATAAYQGDLVRRPDGRFERRGR